MEPLVSVIILTFNSSEFVLEALESVKAQRYSNVELIITDDASTDETLELCRNWLAINKNRFVRAELIESKINTGISANCNRGILAARGEWVKIIAGDDILVPELLYKQIEYLQLNPDIKFLWTNVCIFFDTPQGRQFSIPDKISSLKINEIDVSAKEQFQITLRSNPVFTAGMISKKEIYDLVGLYDETYKAFEDLPFIHKVLLSGIKLHYLDIIGAYYRKHLNSVQIDGRIYLRNQHNLDSYRYRLVMLRYFNNVFERYAIKVEAKYNLFYTSCISNKRNLVNKALLYIPTLLLQNIASLFNAQYR